MKRLVLLCLLALLACKKEAPPPIPARTTPMAPNQPMGIDKPDRARVEIDLANARAAVRTIYGINNAFPKSISELNVRFSYPTDLDYDPASGMVHSKTYPSL